MCNNVGNGGWKVASIQDLKRFVLGEGFREKQTINNQIQPRLIDLNLINDGSLLYGEGEIYHT